MSVELLFQKWNLDNVEIRGDEAWCLCPFHDDSRSSFSVNLVTGKWNCFSCSAHGRSMTGLVASIEGVSYSKADDILETYGFDSVAALKQQVRMLLKKKFDRKLERLWDDDNETNEWKHYTGMVAPYMLDRGFSKAILRQNNIGYDKRNQLVTIPVFEDKTCRFVYTRITWRKKDPKRPSYHYPRGFDRRFYLWGIDKPFNFYNGKDIVLCEGSLDALWLRQHGYSHAVAILGSYLSWEQLRKIEAMDPASITLAFDNDKGGIDCTISTAKMLMRAGFGSCYYLRFPRGLNDPQDATPEQLTRMFTRKRSVRRLTWNQQASRRHKILLAS